MQGYRDHEESGNHNITPIIKGKNKALVTDPKEMKSYELPEKELKIIILKKLSEMQKTQIENYTQIRKTMHEQNKKIEIFQKELN